MLLSAAFVLGSALLASAAPVKRAVTDNEVLVMTFADVLEQLESQFYQQALAKFQPGDFISAGFSSAQIPVDQFRVIQGDEAAHSVALRAFLQSFGKQPVTTCQFNFDSVLTDVTTMAATARVVENVGVGAYLGGATLISDPVLLTAAGSILTIEARHQSILNVLNGGSAIPNPFDIALAPSEVLALAGPFISGCDLGIPSNVPLAITNQGVPGPGTKLTFGAASINGTLSEDRLFCQMLVGGAPSSITLPFSDCVVPSGINGPVAIWVTSDGQPLNNNVRDRANTQIVAGPAIAFIDTIQESLGSLARGGSVQNLPVAPAAPLATDTNTAGFSQPTDATATTTAGFGLATPVNGFVNTTSTISFDQANSVLAAVAVSSDAPQPTDSAASSASVAPQATGSVVPPAPGAPGGPNEFVGDVADGSITVNGWSNVPNF